MKPRISPSEYVPNYILPIARNDMVEKYGQAGADIQVTEKKIEPGADEFRATCLATEPVSEAVERVFRAMAEVSQKKQTC